MRARRVLSIFKDVPLRTRRALSLYKVYGDSTLLVLNRTSWNRDNALLALNWQYIKLKYEYEDQELKAIHANLWVYLHHNFVYILSFYGHLYEMTNVMININCGSFLTLDDNGPYLSMSYFRHFYAIYFMAGSLRPIVFWQFCNNF